MSPTAAGPGADAAAVRALELVRDGTRIGLGSGRAALAFVAQLGARVRDGLRVRGVPTSQVTARAAREAGIPLAELSEGPLDLTVDGADEVAPNLDLVKGWGGAFVRERIVAAASARQVIVVGEEKLVRRLGEHGRLPVEVIPDAVPLVLPQLESLGLVPVVRAGADGGPFLTENGNHILDAAPAEPLEPSMARALERRLLALPGVIDTGLFLGTAERVLVGHPDGRVDTLLRDPVRTQSH